MRQFALIKTFKTTKSSELKAGEACIEYLNDGAPTAASTGKEFAFANLVVKLSDDVQPYMIPIAKNNFSYVKGSPVDATTFEATFTVAAPTQKGDYSIIIVKNGTKFNERNKWTGMVHITDTTSSATALAEKLVSALNGNANHGLVASNAGAIITLKANEAGIDYTILGADLLQDKKPVVKSQGIPAYGDGKYVHDLMFKAIADNGINTTFRDAYTYLYPNLFGDITSNYDGKKFTIFTLRFAEPRAVKTMDDVVNQIVQVVFASDATGADAFETICKGLAGIETSDSSSE